VGWDGLTGLKRLHLRRNKIEKVDDELPALESLEYLNLRANKMSSMEQVEKLFKNPNLKDLSVLNNTIEQNMSSFEVLVADTLSKNPKLKRFCKLEIQDVNRLQAVHYKQFKWTRSEEERKKRLAEEKAKAEKEEV